MLHLIKITTLPEKNNLLREVVETAPIHLARAAIREILVVSTVSYGFAHMTAKSHTLVRRVVCSHSMAFQGFNSIENG